jgi:hypothetical protein
MDTIRDGVNRAIHQKSAAPNQPTQLNVYYPHGIVQPQAPTSMSEVQEQLPF